MAKPKTPMALKVAKGTYRPSRHGPQDAEVQPCDFGDDTPPETLGAIGATKWVETVALLRQMQIITAADRDALLIYCTAWDRRAHYSEIIEKDGEFLPSLTGSLQKHPALFERRQAEMAIERFQKQYAMTAVARAGLNVGGNKGKPKVATRNRAS